MADEHPKLAEDRARKHFEEADRRDSLVIVLLFALAIIFIVAAFVV